MSAGLRPTRFSEIQYRCDGPALWRFYDVTDPGRASAVGPQYASKAELLADLTRYATEYGCEGTK